ncbi:MAG: DUF2809 domain-containing protein [Tenuifilaceae bacterium]|nr:DUF2809 domain-containing protein [Tenuifilaceae bacterium]
MNKSRNRFLYTLILAVLVFLGLMLRHLSAHLPHAINLMLGDAIWASMIFVLLAIVLKKVSTARVALASLLFCYAIEITQLYHAPWIDTLRATRIGGLILGFGFLWSDLVAYAVGVAAAAIVEKTSIKLNKKTISNKP